MEFVITSFDCCASRGEDLPRYHIALKFDVDFRRSLVPTTFWVFSFGLKLMRRGVGYK